MRGIEKLDHSEESTNDKMHKYEKHLELYFSCPCTLLDCLKEIEREAWGNAERLEEFEPDYVQELIEMHLETDSEDSLNTINDRITLYREVDRSIREDLYDLRKGYYLFLEAFYQQKEKIAELIKDNSVLNDVVEVISIFETCFHKLDEKLEYYEEAMCYAVYEGHFEELENRYGKNALKHFKKWNGLTNEDYESAFEYVTAFMKYVNESKFSFRLEELASRLNVFCKMKTDDSEKEEPKTKDKDQRPVTLIQFMRKHCEQQKIQLLRYRRKSLNDANFRKSITLPEPIRNWKTGQAKYYNPSDLKQKWPNFCEILPNLPPLKQSK